MNENTVLRLIRMLQSADDFEDMGWTVDELKNIDGYRLEVIKEESFEGEFEALIEELSKSESFDGVHHVKQFGGMDKGSDYYVIHRVGEMFIKSQTWYASHYGIDSWDMPFEVKAHEKVIVEYR